MDAKTNERLFSCTTLLWIEKVHDVGVGTIINKDIDMNKLPKICISTRFYSLSIKVVYTDIWHPNHVDIYLVDRT